MSGCSLKTFGQPGASDEPIFTIPIKEEFYAPFVSETPPQDGNIVRVSVGFGTWATLQNPELAQMLLEAAADPYQRIDTQKAKLGSQIEIQNEKGTALLKFQIAAGHTLFAKDKSGWFILPDTVYYQLKYQLARHNAMLIGDGFSWDPEQGKELLELNLPSILQVALTASYGSDTVRFASYKLYPMEVSNGTIKLSLLVVHAGYDLSGSDLEMRYRMVTPALLTLKKDASDTWRLAGYREYAQEGKSLRSIIQSTQPFEVLDLMLKDTEWVDDMKNETQLQAAAWLAAQGLTGTVNENQ